MRSRIVLVGIQNKNEYFDDIRSASNGIFAHFQEMLFVDVQAVTQMLAQYNGIIQSLSEPEVSIKLKAIRVCLQLTPNIME